MRGNGTGSWNLRRGPNTLKRASCERRDVEASASSIWVTPLLRSDSDTIHVNQPNKPSPLFITLSRLIAVAMVATASIAILSTSRVFSGTVDEPAHIAAGLQWLSTGEYNYDLQHPPLGRIAAAIGPYLRGSRTTGTAAIYDEGAKILGDGAHYVDTLASARRGELAFFVLLAGAVWCWARRTIGEAGAAAAIAMLVCNPNILAHAGLATTDVACAATTTLALLAAMWWAERPTLLRSAAFGAALALAIGSRLSAIAFVGGTIAAAYVVRGLVAKTWRMEPSYTARGTARALAAVGFTTAFLIWAIYRFSVGPMQAGGAVVPAPAFVDGMRTFLLHGSTGHPTFLLGTPSNRGWWYDFPIAVAVKTPLPLVLFSIVGAASAVRNARVFRDWAGLVPLVGTVAMLGISTLVRVDLGVRLVLPVYPLLAILAAQGVVEAWRGRATVARRGAVLALAVATLFIPVHAYPDWLAYFNLLAGRRPESVLVDSNLDWGQDLYRLRDTIVASGITDSIYVAYFGTADLSAAGVPRARLLGLHERRPGWIAASKTYLAGEWVGGAYQWLYGFRPVARIGPSMLLWHIPPPGQPPATTGSSPR